MDIGQLRVSLGLNSAEFVEGANRASGSSKRLQGDIGNLDRAARGFDMRGASQQFSQVAQQAMATGDPIRALAIQLPDLALGFGPIGIAAGIAGGALLPFAANLLGVGGAAEDVGDRLEGARSSLDAYRAAQDAANLSTAEAADLWGTLAPAIQAGNRAYSEIAAVNAFNELDAALQGVTESYGGFSTAMETANAGGRSAGRQFREIDDTIANMASKLTVTEEQARLVVEAMADIANAPGLEERIIAAAGLSEAFKEAFGSAEQIPLELRELAEEGKTAAEVGGEINAELNQMPGALDAAGASANEFSEFLRSAHGWAQRAREEMEKAAGATMDNHFDRNAAVPFAVYGSQGINDAASRGILDLIAAVEGTNGPQGYNTTLGYGAFTGGQTDLVNMTLAEIRDLQRQMLAHPDNNFNSSAVGRYQIVGTTLEGLIDQLGLEMGELFTPALQDRLALELVRQVGGPSGIAATWEGFGAKGVSEDTISRALGSEPIPGVDPVVAREAAEAERDRQQAIEDATTAAARELGLREDLISAADRAAQDAALELALVGKTAEEQARLRVAYDLANQAAANGIDLNETIAGSTMTYGERISEAATAAGRAAGQQEALAAAEEAAAEAAARAADATAQFASNLASVALGPLRDSPLGGILDIIPGVQEGAASVFEDLFDGGGFTAIGDALSGATSGIAGLGGAIGSLAGPVGIGISLFQGIMGVTEKLDEGLRVSIDGFNAAVEEFEKTRTTRFWGLSSSTDTDFDPAGKEVAGPINRAYDEVAGHVLDLARTMGKSARDFRGFSYDFQLSLEGMSDEEKIRAVEAEFGKVSDKLARMAGAAAKFGDDGQTATEILEGMVASFGAVKAAYAVLFDENLKAGESATKLATRVVDAAGGIDEFTRSVDFYAANFLSLGEQAGEAQQAFFKGLRQAGISEQISTQEQFREVVDRLQANGRDRKVAGLLALADEFDRWQDLLAESQKDAVQAAEEASRGMEALADQREGLERRILELQGNTAELRRRELEALDDTLDPLQMMIWGLEDMKDVMGAIDPSDFASRFDFEKAQGLAANSVTTPIPVFPLAGGTDQAAETKALRQEIAAMREENRQLQLQVGDATNTTARLLRKWDAIGMPNAQAT